jgi:hypothetical protein
VSAYTAGWLAWIAWFAIEETVAIFRGGANTTLSAHIWKWFAIDGQTSPTALTRIRRFTLLAALAWLATHLLTGGAF